MTPADMCTMACLHAATKPARCRCVGCGGRLHGAGRDESAYLDALIEGRRRFRRMTDLEVLVS